MNCRVYILVDLKPPSIYLKIVPQIKTRLGKTFKICPHIVMCNRRLSILKILTSSTLHINRRAKVKAGALIRRRKLEDCRLLMKFIQSVVDVRAYVKLICVICTYVCMCVSVIKLLLVYV